MKIPLQAFTNAVSSIRDYNKGPWNAEPLSVFISQLAEDLTNFFIGHVFEKESTVHEKVGEETKVSHNLKFEDRNLVIGYTYYRDDVKYIYIIVALVNEIGDKPVRTHKAVFYYDVEKNTITEMEQEVPKV